MKLQPTFYAPLFALALATGCDSAAGPIGSPPPPPPPPPSYVTYETLGDSVSIAAKLTEFRAALGGQLNAPNSPPADSGRREINWDGVPAALTDVDTFPAGFFNANSKRGAVYATPGTGLRVDSTDFASVNAGLAAQFTTFSAKKLFMPVGSNVVDVSFRLVGTTTLGLVKGFGAVFVDVDKPGSTTIEFFDAQDQSLGVVRSPNHTGGAQLLSFVGAVFEAPIVARVRITSGDAALTATIQDVSAGGAADLVVMDDFLFGEPRAQGPDAQVSVGDNFFRSANNGSQNPAVDTINAGASVKWTWTSGTHSIRSTGVPPAVFRNSVVMSGAGATYSVRLIHPGTYDYDCAVHGAAMSGRIVVK